MADDKQAVTDGSDDAKQAAAERMKAALEAQKRGEDIVVDQASLEASEADAQVSGATKVEKDKFKEVEPLGWINQYLS